MSQPSVGRDFRRRSTGIGLITITAMGLVDELNKLSELHESGQLSDAEFDEAKTKLIRDFTGSGGSSTGTSGGDTAGGMATSSAPEPPPPEEPPPGTFQPTTRVKSAARPPPPPPPQPVPAGGTAPGVIPGSYGARPLSTPTTTIRSGLGTGSVSIGGMAPVTRLKNRAQGLAHPSTIEPERSTVGTFLRSLAWLTIPVLFCSLMIATAGAAIFPAMARLTAPVLCEAPFDHSYVDITTTPGDEAGETNINWELQCYDDNGVVQSKGTFTPMLYLFIGFTALFFVIGAFFMAISRLRRRGRGEQVQVGPEVSESVLSGADGPVFTPPA